MIEYNYDFGEEARSKAMEIAEIKDAQKVLSERLQRLTEWMVSHEMTTVDWVDGSDRRWYVRMQRSPKHEVDLKLLTAMYPQYVSKVTKLVEDKERLNRLIDNGLIDPEKVIRTTFSKPFPKVYEWKDGKEETEQ